VYNENMTTELELERKEGLRVGFRVQLSTENDPSTAKEGVLIAIYRAAARQHFRFAVDWQDGSETQSFSRKELACSKYSDYPQWDSTVARSQKWNQGDVHYWILFDKSDGSSCLFCGRMRVYMAKDNEKPCKGPQLVTFR
jgi:hypothetical protein